MASLLSLQCECGLFLIPPLYIVFKTLHTHTLLQKLGFYDHMENVDLKMGPAQIQISCGSHQCGRPTLLVHQLKLMTPNGFQMSLKGEYLQTEAFRS